MRKVKRIREPLNHATAQAIFEKYAICLNGRDVLSKKTAVALFGHRITEYVWKWCTDSIFQSNYEFSEKISVPVFHKDGFFELVTNHNILLEVGKKA